MRFTVLRFTVLRFTVLAFGLLCAACAPYRLVDGGTIPPGKTKDQVQLDVLTCKDVARMDADSGANQARGFMLGLTLNVVGVAIDYQAEKAQARRVFAGCMSDKGYVVRVATD